MRPTGASFLPYARRALEIVREGTDAARLAQTGELRPQSGVMPLGRLRLPL
jgi:hypothetical protein